jgi:hypothetical protein
MAADAARLRGFKANLTARINAATAQYDAVNDLLNPTARQLDDLQAVSDKITEQMERIREFLVQLITDAEDDDEAATWQTELTAAETRANTAIGRLATLIGRFTGPPPGMPAPPGAAAAGGAAAAHGGRCKAIDALRPQSLTTEFTPVEYRVWRSHFDAYYTASNFAAAPLAEQRAYFFRCLDGVLERRIRPFCLPATPIYNTPLEKGCMGRLDDEFADVYPVIVRRINFMKCKQTSVRQPWAEFYATLRAHGDEADLPTINPEDLYVMRLIAGTADPLLRDKFFREAIPRPRSSSASPGSTSAPRIRTRPSTGRRRPPTPSRPTAPRPRTSRPRPRQQPRFRRPTPPCGRVFQGHHGLAPCEGDMHHLWNKDMFGFVR